MAREQAKGEAGMQQCYRIFVSGVVQGVFFRESTRQQALALGIAGWVRNRHDGRVEILACAEVMAMESLLKWLKTGPKLAKVTKIESIKTSTHETGERLPGRFEVRQTV